MPPPSFALEVAGDESAAVSEVPFSSPSTNPMPRPISNPDLCLYTSFHAMSQSGFPPATSQHSASSPPLYPRFSGSASSIGEAGNMTSPPLSSLSHGHSTGWGNGGLPSAHIPSGWAKGGLKRRSSLTESARLVMMEMKGEIEGEMNGAMNGTMNGAMKGEREMEMEMRRCSTKRMREGEIFSQGCAVKVEPIPKRRGLETAARTLMLQMQREMEASGTGMAGTGIGGSSPGSGSSRQQEVSCRRKCLKEAAKLLILEMEREAARNRGETTIVDGRQQGDTFLLGRPQGDTFLLGRQLGDTAVLERQTHDVLPVSQKSAGVQVHARSQIEALIISTPGLRRKAPLFLPHASSPRETAVVNTSLNRAGSGPLNLTRATTVMPLGCRPHTAAFAGSNKSTSLPTGPELREFQNCASHDHVSFSMASPTKGKRVSEFGPVSCQTSQENVTTKVTFSLVDEVNSVEANAKKEWPVVFGVPLVPFGQSY